MSYIEDNQMADERVIYRTTITKAVFLWPTLLLLMGLKVGLIFLVGIGLAVYLYLAYTSSEFAVTNGSS
jgi:hypothetical protein